MNGRVMRCVLTRDPDNICANTLLPKSIQFDESSRNYRCLCNCFHIKTGTLVIASTELLMLLIFLLNSILMFYMEFFWRIIAGTHDSYVIEPFPISIIGIGLSSLAVVLLFIGVIRNTAALLIPHLIAQVIAITLLAFALTCSIIAFSTDTIIFYRLMNGISFKQHPSTTTLSMDVQTTIRFISVFIFYLICFCWYVVITYNCYRYLKERCQYMNYCLAFSTPMKTLTTR
ncbi:unnamed protein product [Thelazia callipaeda]|uniref:MARVEL domain-containing protein n=1 Tax=Thelazia callipaeda TaxID=103827 RepID=A0A0N5CUN2_THECL|nr:unnamed protein product [Thelazia callipaeda]